MLLKHSPAFYVCEHSLNMWSDNKFKCLILRPSYAVSWFRFLQIWGLQKQLPKGVTEAATLRKRCSENMQQIYSRTPFFFLITKAKKKKKYSCLRKCGWREKSSPGQPQIYFFKLIFRRYSVFFFSSFCFFGFLFFFFVVCLLFSQIKNVLSDTHSTEWAGEW